VRAFRMGGSDEAPRLRVYVSELLAAIEADAIWLPPSLKKRPVRRLPSRQLHPAAAAM
jgi:hypothetical protein